MSDRQPCDIKHLLPTKTWHASERAKFKVGDRVRISDYALERDYQSATQSHISRALFDAYEKKREERGTIIAAGDNGYALGAAVYWDNGRLSECMEHMLDHADKPIQRETWRR
jgi:hypothetical protein